MIHVGPPWPLSIVTGFLGSGKTTLIGRLLRHAGMADTVVIVNEFGEIGLDHHLIKPVADNVILLPNGCLCCTVRQDIIQTLRELHRLWLAGSMPDFGRVLVETTGLAEPSPLLASVATHPLLADVFALAAVTTVVDGEYGLRQLTENSTCWNQAAVADYLVISKCDLVGPAKVVMLREHLTGINPLAEFKQHPPQDENLGYLFERGAGRPSRSTLMCDSVPDHLAHVTTVLLRAQGPLSWRRFQIWLNGLLVQCGSSILRLKGCLVFDEFEAPVIIQAVHQTFYPVIEAPPDVVGRCDNFLVLMTARPLPIDLAAEFALCAAANGGRPKMAGSSAQ